MLSLVNHPWLSKSPPGWVNHPLVVLGVFFMCKNRNKKPCTVMGWVTGAVWSFCRSPSVPGCFVQAELRMEPSPSQLLGSAQSFCPVVLFWFVSSSWWALLHPQCPGLALNWNWSQPQVPKGLRTLRVSGSKWHKKVLLHPVTAAEHSWGHFDFSAATKMSVGILRTKNHQNSQGKGKTPLSLAPLCCSGLRYLHLQEVEKIENNPWNDISLCLKGRERGNPSC